MEEYDNRIADAIQVARLYYYQNLKTEEIAHEMKVSRSTVSRLLSYAKDQGLVEIRVRDPRERPQRLEKQIQQQFQLPYAHVVSVPEVAGEHEWLSRVATFTAKHLNTLLVSGSKLGIAWGNTVSAVSRHLTPKPLTGLEVIQLNGAGNTQGAEISYAGEILTRFARNYDAQTQLFPVPTFFDYPETKQALWRERSVQRILQLQADCDILLYSVGVIDAERPNYGYGGGDLEPADLATLKAENVVGDIGTVFFRADASYKDITLNQRASGPDLSLYQTPRRAICAISGLDKVDGLLAALRGEYLTDLIIDEPTAQVLLAKAEEREMVSG